MDSVDPKVLVYGVSCFAFFLAWLFGRKSASLASAFDTLPSALVAFGALCATPLFGYIAWQQFGSKARLEAEDFPPCAALGHAIGAQGGRAPRWIWRFETLDVPARILDFYKERLARAGWRVEARKNGFLGSGQHGRFAVWTEHNGNRDELVFQKGP